MIILGFEVILAIIIEIQGLIARKSVLKYLRIFKRKIMKSPMDTKKY